MRDRLPRHPVHREGRGSLRDDLRPGLSGEESINAMFRREEIAVNLYSSWSKKFLEALGGVCI